MSRVHNHKLQAWKDKNIDYHHVKKTHPNTQQIVTVRHGEGKTTITSKKRTCIVSTKKDYHHVQKTKLLILPSRPKKRTCFVSKKNTMTSKKDDVDAQMGSVSNDHTYSVQGFNSYSQFFLSFFLLFLFYLEKNKT